MDFKKDFPESSQLANEVREIFGNGVRLIYAKEGDKEITTDTQATIDSMVSVSPFPLQNRYESTVPKRGRR